MIHHFFDFFSQFFVIFPPLPPLICAHSRRGLFFAKNNISRGKTLLFSRIHHFLSISEHFLLISPLCPPLIRVSSGHVLMKQRPRTISWIRGGHCRSPTKQKLPFRKDRGRLVGSARAGVPDQTTSAFPWWPTLQLRLKIALIFNPSFFRFWLDLGSQNGSKID